MNIRNKILAGAAAILAAGPALAQVSASAATELNLRSGPSTGFEVVGVIPAEGQVEVLGCLDESPWCQVSFDGTEAWAHGDYLVGMVAEAPQPLYENRQALTIGSVIYEPETSDDEAALGLGAMGAAAGAIIGGPAAIAAGAALGMVGGAVTNPDPEVVTYIQSNPVDPVYLTGEVVPGAGIPDEVVLYETPAPEFRYANINGQLVVVEPEERRVVHIIR